MAQTDPLADILARLERLEKENADLRAKVDQLSTAAPKRLAGGTSGAGASAKGGAADSPNLPAYYDASAVDAAINARIAALEEDQWKLGLNPNGGGFFFKSPDENFTLRLLGYAQSQLTLTNGANGTSFGEADMRIRRARLDWIANFYKNYELFIEIDAAPLGGTSLVEARLNAKVVDDLLQVRLGKFTTPFSTENWRTSRGIDTIERYIALNSMFSVPGLDVQTGGMVWGILPLGEETTYDSGGTQKKFRPTLNYYAGVWNGNASASNENPGGFGGNSRDNNNDKEYQMKLTLNPHPHWSFGVGYDHNTSESAEGLTMASLSGVPYIRTGVGGDRDGFSADFLWEPGRFSLRGEAMYFDFAGADMSLSGGFLQAAYFIKGNSSKGLQPIVRVEHASLDGGALADIDGNSISAVTAGFNWYLNGNVRVQLNYIGEYFDGAGNASIGADSFRSSVLGQLQIRF